MAAAIPIWLILLTVVVLVLVLGGAGGATVMRKLLLVVLFMAGAIVAISLIVYPFRRHSRNVYIPPPIEAPLGGASVHIGDSAMRAVTSDGASATMQISGAPPSSTHAGPAKFLLIGVPALAALAALAAVRRSRGNVPSHGSGLLWLAAGAAALVLLGFVFTARVDRGAPAMQAINVYPEPLLAPSAPTDRALIDHEWERLTGPRIALDNPAAPPAAQEELQNAAETIQAASEKMAETTSKGWLYVATKTFLDAQPKQPEPASDAEPSRAAGHSPSAVRSARPEWVIRPPGIVGNVRKVVVSAGPFKTLDECHIDLENQMREVVARRIAELASAATGGRVHPPQLESLNIGTDYILRELCPEPEYVEEVEASFGPMKRAYVLVEFTEAQDAVLLDRWKTYARRDRLAMAAFGATLVVGGLALAYGLLKVDTWTRGYYSKRLFVGVPAAIIGVVWLLWFLG